MLNIVKKHNWTTENAILLFVFVNVLQMHLNILYTIKYIIIQHWLLGLK